MTPEPTPLSAPVDRYDGDEFVFTWPDHGVAIGVEHVRETAAGLEGEILISSSILGDLHWGRLHLASTNGRETLVRKLEKVERNTPWRPMLERVCRHVATEVRAGAPIVRLTPATLPIQTRGCWTPVIC